MFRALITVVIGLAVTAPVATAAEPTAYVINTTGETLSKVNLTSGQVTNDIVYLGSDVDCYPNQIVVRDTLAYVLISGTDEIQIINLVTETTVGWIYLPNGSNPYWMAFLNDHYLYVTLMTANSVARVDVDLRQVVTTIPVGLSPEGIIAYDDRMYVAVTGYDFGSYSWGEGKVAVIAPETDEVVDEIPVGTNPQYLDFDRQGRIHVSCTGDYWLVPGVVYIIEAFSGTVLDSLPVGGQPGQISVSPGDRVFLAAGGWAEDGEVFSYHALSGEIYHDAGNPIYIDSGATGIAAFQDSTVLATCFGDRMVRLTSGGEKAGTYYMGDGPVHLDFNYLPGDANGDWVVNVGDAVFLINYIFKQGARPVFPAWRGNVNGDGGINVGDAVYLVNFIFKDGARPKIGPTWLR